MPEASRAGSGTIANSRDFTDTTGAGTDGYAIVWDNATGKFILAAMSGGSGTPGGSDTQIQYNSSGSFAGESGITRTAAGTLALSTALVAPVIRPASDSTTALQLQTASGTAVLTVDTTNKVVSVRSDSVSTSAPGTKVLELANSTSTFSFYRVHNSGIALDRWTMRFLPNPLYSTTPMDIAVDWNNGNSAINLTNLGINFINTSSAFLQSGTQLNLNISASNIFQLWQGAGVGLGMQYRPDSYWKIVNAFASYNIIYASAAGYVAMGHGSPTCVLDIAASTTSRASIRIRSGTAPTSPNDGDVWKNTDEFVMFASGSNTNTVLNALRLRRGTSGTPAAGYGSAINLQLQSSTTAGQDAGRLSYEWVTATHASRAARGKLTAYYTSTEQEAMRWDGDTGGVKLGFYGQAAVTRQLLATGAGATVDDVITALQNLGLLKQS